MGEDVARHSGNADLLCFICRRATGFCARCGSPLTYENERVPDEVHLLAGALSDPERARATAHVFAGEQLSWFDTADDLPRYETTRRNAQPIRHGPRK